MTINRSTLRRTAVALVAAGTASLMPAACGSGGDGAPAHGSHASASASAPASAGQHNAVDTAFAKGMIPHHRQAVEMADLAPSRARSAAVKKLAEEIKKAQDPEIETLSGWLTSWGEDVPAAGSMDHSGHDMGDMGGMMTGEDMAELKKAKGRAFDTAFLDMMIEHHEGAVEMAKAERSGGAHARAKKMADRIITSQSAEIDRMNQLLGRD
ncbi:DUF305 domain-containing protein [Streptomyces sp. NBC_00525]|uniref:DUF305 domain-containing protein n=1 Tax=Streptomyces sp. NBC_00525 TaxID=2903660 RepID=UPI002E823F2D|nr:DUF305 domain-containing protein [Streptomyces sp. NBC_00525]WUC92260.1 DUF305 domain-containing protein [Streptomyces sp. NBC_00525]